MSTVQFVPNCHRIVTEMSASVSSASASASWCRVQWIFYGTKMGEFADNGGSFPGTFTLLNLLHIEGSMKYLSSITLLLQTAVLEPSWGTYSHTYSHPGSRIKKEKRKEKKRKENSYMCMYCMHQKIYPSENRRYTYSTILGIYYIASILSKKLCTHGVAINFDIIYFRL